MYHQNFYWGGGGGGWGGRDEGRGESNSERCLKERCGIIKESHLKQKGA